MNVTSSEVEKLHVMNVGSSFFRNSPLIFTKNPQLFSKFDKI